MSNYTPEAPPNPDANTTWVMRELKRVVDALLEAETRQWTVLHAAPQRVSEGLVAFADGTDWNPGSGVGLYEYRSGAWAKL